MNLDIGRVVKNYSECLTFLLGGNVIEEPAVPQPNQPVFRSIIPDARSSILLVAYSRPIQFFVKEDRSPKLLSRRSESFIVVGVEQNIVRPLTFECFSAQVSLAVVTMRPSTGSWELPDYVFGQNVVRAAYYLINNSLYAVNVSEKPSPGEITDFITQRYDLDLYFEVKNIYPPKGDVYV